MRHSSVIAHKDSAGDYEVEIFDVAHPKHVIVTSHGNGVRRWDGKHLFHNLAEHCSDSVVLLVDQNQPEGDGCRLNSLPQMIRRVQSLIELAHKNYPGVPVAVVGHSMGCGVAAELDLDGVSAVVFTSPTAGDEVAKNVKRYGGAILQGQLVTTSDGLLKVITKKYMDSVKGIVWEDEYRKMLKRFKPVYVFESGDEEIVSDHRFEHRDIFQNHQIIPHATHNMSGAPLEDFFSRLDKILQSM